MKSTLMNGFLFFLIVVLATPSFAQSNQLVGSWRLVAADKILPDGRRVADYGAAPHGIAIFTADGHYMVEIFRTIRAKFASGNPANGTLEEYKYAFQDHSCHFGTYSVDSVKGSIAFHIDRAANPTWDQSTQVRSFVLKGDSLSWQVPARPDGSIPLSAFRRIQ